MYTFLILVHIIVSLFLIAVILLQAGRGGGLADSFGGSQMQSLFGTKSTNVLTKLTTICAVVFIVTCLSLAMMSSRKSKSLVEKINIPEVAQNVEVETEDVKEEQPVSSSVVGPEEEPSNTQTE